MDSIDRNILAELQVDGRLTVTELADRVGLTPAPCHRRLRELERVGAIAGYRAVVTPEAVGLGFGALVFITLREANKEVLGAFERAVVEIPNVIQAQRVFGDLDYLVHVVTRDLAHFQDLYDEELSALPGVLRLSSTLVMRQVVDRPLPL
ncbi:Lrp/AsnC family transcriptional regulator [Tessaracoccus lacteus]|uniref:Lrp/AsnC family transcriptional regulator n=1 Tax=Tessaracoccus lacteus TaxID=3041766 RepID=A0ABY8PWB9_9ACTN|nr:Lrp/AsnC family transcriptional regulator [Tessaracoccus sp. T21]WGT46787.1 Lrp/AsnC family transcriptional regulator [Tessaracoccus sp. T21]